MNPIKAIPPTPMSNRQKMTTMMRNKNMTWIPSIIHQKSKPPHINFQDNLISHSTGNLTPVRMIKNLFSRIMK